MNNSPISKDKLNFLNSLLDKELEQLKQTDSNLFQKSQPSSHVEYDQSKLQQSSVRALSNNPQSRVFNNTTLESHTILHNSDYNELQDKIFNLENRIQKNVDKQQYLHQIPQKYKESDDETPMKNKYNHQNSNKKKIQFNQTRNEQKKAKKSPELDNERTNKFKLEKQIENAESKLSQSKTTSRKILNQSQIKSKSREKSQKNLTPQIHSQEKDLIVLQNKVSQMRRQMDDDKQQLIKEKQKNQLLQQQVELLNKKLKKQQSQTEKHNSIEQEYQRLLENFEKSEYIRQQQKSLIQTLKQEIEELKCQKHQEDNSNQRSNQKAKKKKKVLDENTKYQNK